MSSSRSPIFQTFFADAAITKGMAVKFGSDENHVAKGSANTSKCVGIAMGTAVSAEDAIEVATIGGGAKGLLGETVVAGSYLVSHTDGTLFKPNTAGDHVVAYAREGGDAGDIIDVDVVCFEAYDSEA